MKKTVVRQSVQGVYFVLIVWHASRRVLSTGYYVRYRGRTDLASKLIVPQMLSGMLKLDGSFPIFYSEAAADERYMAVGNMPLH